MNRITRKLEWDAGHRVVGHEGKCRHLHGHRYVAEISVSAFGLDDIGRVIDFSLVKGVVGKWIDDNWDHNFMANASDPLIALCETPRHQKLAADLIDGKIPYVMKYGNPTAENIARELYEKACELLQPTGITVDSVRIYETPNCWADYGRPNG